MANLDGVQENEAVSEFLLSIENKIMERGLLTEIVGMGGFMVTLHLEKCIWRDAESLKVVLDLEPNDGDLSLSADQCDDIQDVVLDYLNDKGLGDVLEDYGIENGSEDVNWVHVSINGKYLYD